MFSLGHRFSEEISLLSPPSMRNSDYIGEPHQNRVGYLTWSAVCHALWLSYPCDILAPD